MGTYRSKFASSLVGGRVLDTHSDLRSCFSEMTELARGCLFNHCLLDPWIYKAHKKKQRFSSFSDGDSISVCVHMQRTGCVCLQRSSLALKDRHTTTLTKKKLRVVKTGQQGQIRKGSLALQKAAGRSRK